MSFKENTANKSCNEDEDDEVGLTHVSISNIIAINSHQNVH